MNYFDFAEQSLQKWNKILMREYLPSDIEEKIEEIIENLEYIKDWEPSDYDMITNNSCGTPWHDGCR